MSRLDKEKETCLQPKRMEFAKKAIADLGYEITTEGETFLEFKFKNNIVRFFPYSGWATGVSIKDGRGIENLLKQIKQP